jgi:hypothetical protein
MRIGGVASQDNESDILTKYLQPPLHEKHTLALHIKQTKRTTTLTNCVNKLTLNGRLVGNQEGNKQVTPPYCHRAVMQQPLENTPSQLDPPLHSVPHLQAHTLRREVFTSAPEVLLENHVEHVFRRTRRNPRHRQLKVMQKIAHHQHILMRGPPPNTRHDPPTYQGRYVNPAIPELPPAFMDLIYPPHHPANGTNSQPPRCCDTTEPRADNKTRKKHRQRSKKRQQIRHTTRPSAHTDDTSSHRSSLPPNGTNDATYKHKV